MRHRAGRFRAAYAAAVAKPVLNELVRGGRPRLSETITARAAIIAVKDPALPGREDREEPVQAAKNAACFRSKVLGLFKEAGAVIIACEGDTVLACFGSSLERIYLEQTRAETLYGDDPNAFSSHHPAIKAAGFITELIQRGEQDWRYGIDCGVCAFSWSPETGYTANGRAVVRARILASLAPRCKARVLITDSVREKLNQPAKKLNSLGRGEDKENFYELLTS
jgi:class 3 adenylate cyclase